MSLGKAFSNLWEFIEELSLDQLAENDLKNSLRVLGKTASLAEERFCQHRDKQDELEARFFLEMKYGEAEACLE